MLIAVSHRRRGRNLLAKSDTAITSLSANHAYPKTLYRKQRPSPTAARQLYRQRWRRTRTWLAGGPARSRQRGVVRRRTPCRCRRCTRETTDDLPHRRTRAPATSRDWSVSVTSLVMSRPPGSSPRPPSWLRTAHHAATAAPAAASHNARTNMHRPQMYYESGPPKDSQRY